MITPAIPIEDESATTQRRMGELLAAQRNAQIAEGPPSERTRVDRINRLIGSLLDHEDDIVQAVSNDFGYRSHDYTRFADIAAIVETLRFARKNLGKWMRPQRRRLQFPLGLLGARGEVHHQPFGVVGVLSPWNFPVNLAFAPMAGILAAGNRAMVKPSEVTPRSADVISRVVAKAFDETDVAVITGGPEIGQAFTKLPFDHLLFTGGTNIARHVMRAAADNLVPLTLELGGKCPVVVGREADLSLVARNVIAVKCGNAGQICLAPDYVLVPKDQEAQLIEELRLATERMFDGLVENPDYTSIVNSRHHQRISGYVHDAREKGAEILELNPKNESFEGQKHHKMPPTLVRHPTDEMKVMQEEIFGPVMPIRTYDAIDEAIAYVNAHERPLALYYFGPKGPDREAVLSRTTSGGVAVNDVMTHYLHENLPFGGVGPSGMGAYHGRDGFLNFSHKKSVYLQTRVDAFKMLRPPYGASFRKATRKLLAP